MGPHWLWLCLLTLLYGYYATLESMNKCKDMSGTYFVVVYDQPLWTESILHAFVNCVHIDALFLQSIFPSALVSLPLHLLVRERYGMESWLNCFMVHQERFILVIQLAEDCALQSKDSTVAQLSLTVCLLVATDIPWPLS